MKLVDILARELKVWPHSGNALGQAADTALHLNEGASHGGEFYGWTKEKFTLAEDHHEAFVTRTQWEAAVDALKAEKVAEWNGEGLPPVGTVCELRVHKITEWSAAKIEFAYRNVIVWDWIDEPSLNGLCTAYCHDVEFRPIRTPEQIAAEERAAAIVEMLTSAELPVNEKSIRNIGKIYDAGYRKQKDS